MKFRRKPVERDVVDALKSAEHYIVQDAEGTVKQVAIADFERDYEPLTRAPRGSRTKRGAGRKRGNSKDSPRAGATPE